MYDSSKTCSSGPGCTTTSAITVTTTAAVILAAPISPASGALATPGGPRKKIIISNCGGTNAMYVGIDGGVGANVTSSLYNYAIPTNSYIVLDTAVEQNAIYACTGASTTPCAVWVGV